MNTITISDRMKYRPHGGIGLQRQNIRSAETMKGRSMNNNESHRDNNGYQFTLYTSSFSCQPLKLFIHPTNITNYNLSIISSANHGFIQTILLFVPYCC